MELLKFLEICLEDGSLFSDFGVMVSPSDYVFDDFFFGFLEGLELAPQSRKQRFEEGLILVLQLSFSTKLILKLPFSNFDLFLAKTHHTMQQFLKNMLQNVGSD